MTKYLIIKHGFLNWQVFLRFHVTVNYIMYIIGDSFIKHWYHTVQCSQGKIPNEHKTQIQDINYHSRTYISICKFESKVSIWLKVFESFVWDGSTWFHLELQDLNDHSIKKYNQSFLETYRTCCLLISIFCPSPSLLSFELTNRKKNLNTQFEN